MADTCQTCKHFFGGSRWGSYDIPAWCKLHDHAQQYDEPACKQYEKKDEGNG